MTQVKAEIFAKYTQCVIIMVGGKGAVRERLFQPKTREIRASEPVALHCARLRFLHQ